MASIRNGAGIKVYFDVHLLRPNFLFFSLNSPTIRLKKQSFELKILNMKLYLFSGTVPNAQIYAQQCYFMLQ